MEKETHHFTIVGRLPGLNEYVDATRTNRYKGAEMKRDAQRLCENAIFMCWSEYAPKITNPVRIHYTFYEPNKRRDKDNVSGFAHKVIQDALVASGVLKDDGWSEVVGSTDDFDVDKELPRIEVVLEEV